jgi:hypothetical protein
MLLAKSKGREPRVMGFGFENRWAGPLFATAAWDRTEFARRYENSKPTKASSRLATVGFLRVVTEARYLRIGPCAFSLGTSEGGYEQYIL